MFGERGLAGPAAPHYLAGEVTPLEARQGWSDVAATIARLMTEPVQVHDGLSLDVLPLRQVTRDALLAAGCTSVAGLRAEIGSMPEEVGRALRFFDDVIATRTWDGRHDAGLETLVARGANTQQAARLLGFPVAIVEANAARLGVAIRKTGQHHVTAQQALTRRIARDHLKARRRHTR